MNVLLLSGDPGLVDDLLRLAAAASVEVAVASDAGRARALWSRASLVLVGNDLNINSCPRRAGVVIATREEDLSVYRRALDIGAERVAVLPSDESWLTGRLSAACAPGRPGRVVTVTGARGGAGASVLATALALVAARRGLRPLLVDGDPSAGGLDLFLGLETVAGTRWPDLADLRGRLAPDALPSCLPAARGVAVLSHHRDQPVRVPAEVLASVLATARAVYDPIVVDLPRDRLHPADHAVLLVPTDVRSTVTARRLAATLPAPDLRLVTRGPSPARLSRDSVASSLSLPLTGHYDFDRRTAAALEEATLPLRTSLARLCTRLLTSLHPEAPAK